MQNAKTSLPAFRLPASNYECRVKVTAVSSADTLFVRFCDYEEEYKEMVEQMKYFYFKCPRRVTCPLKDSLYVALSATKAARIQVKDINNDNISSYFVDHGFTRNLKISALHEIDELFTKLPAQAFEVKLNFVVQGDDEEEYVSKIVNERVDKVFIARIISKADDKCVVELYFDVEHNVLVDEHCLNVAVNRFKRREPIETLLSMVNARVYVYVTHCVIKNDECVLSIQVNDQHLKKLNDNQEKVNYNCERFGTCLEENRVNYDCIYYVKSCEAWRRVKIVSNDEHCAMVYFLDYGYSNVVSLRQIRIIDALMDANRYLPFLAHDVSLVPRSANDPWRTGDVLDVMKTFGGKQNLMVIMQAADENRIYSQVHFLF